MYHIKIQSYISPDPFPLLQRDCISSIFPFRIDERIQWRDTNQLILPYMIPFPFQRGWLPFESLQFFFSFLLPKYIYIYIDLDFAANVHRTIRRKGGVKLLQRHTTARAENSSVQHACVSRQVRATAKNVQLF